MIPAYAASKLHFMPVLWPRGEISSRAKRDHNRMQDRNVAPLGSWCVCVEPDFIMKHSVLRVEESSSIT
jgi:hypothetical protein